MYRTLSELRDSVNRLIDEQGDHAPCAAFVFTKNDVFVVNYEDGDLVEEYLNAENTDDVLTEVGGCDYIYEQIGEVIDDEVRRVLNKVAS